MKRVSTKEYEMAKIAFLHKHEDWEIETSPMNEDGRYYKTYICTDGSVWYEVNEPVTRKVETTAEVEGIEIEISQDVKLFRTEGWSTDDARSIECYEKY